MRGGGRGRHTCKPLPDSTSRTTETSRGTAARTGPWAGACMTGLAAIGWPCPVAGQTARVQQWTQRCCPQRRAPPRAPCVHRGFAQEMAGRSGGRRALGCEAAGGRACMSQIPDTTPKTGHWRSALAGRRKVGNHVPARSTSPSRTRRVCWGESDRSEGARRRCRLEHQRGPYERVA